MPSITNGLQRTLLPVGRSAGKRNLYGLEDTHRQDVTGKMTFVYTQKRY
jgi:hypothetical protein